MRLRDSVFVIYCLNILIKFLFESICLINFLDQSGRILNNIVKILAEFAWMFILVLQTHLTMFSAIKYLQSKERNTNNCNC